MKAHRFSRRLVRWVSLFICVALIINSLTPSGLASSLTLEVFARAKVVVNQALLSVNAWTMPKPNSQEPVNRGVKPPPPESKAEKEARLARLEINPNGKVQLQSQQPLWFTAIPFDNDGSVIHGLLPEWESNNKQVLFIKKTGQAMAGKPGSAILTARAGSLTATVQVIVSKGNGKRFGGKKNQDSTRGNPLAQLDPTPFSKSNKIARNARTSRRRHHTPPMMFLRPGNEDPLPDYETPSLYQPGNAIGSPPGRRRVGAPTPPAADGVEGENGNKNFTFSLPLAGSPGRGISTSVSLVYNSNVWNKSTDSSSSTWMTYDVDSSWPATGWRITLGQIEDQGSNGFTLTDVDGTRHALVYTSANNYDTTDGTFIHYYGGSGWGILYYPDGTIAYYGAGNGGYRLYPTQIVDRNGNYIVISYAGTNGSGPKISSILDTLQRYIHFYYASNGDLVAITQPGLGTSDIQTMRFYYTDVTIGSGLFASGINVDGPSSVRTLQYVYLPASSESSGAHIGYKFDYSPYGMIREITQYRGMTVSSTSTSSAGSVNSEGTIAARTTYNYPTSGQGYTDVPTYSTRTDDWAGRTTSMNGGAPYYTFSVNESTGVSTVTAPDGTISESHAIVNAGQWNHGLISDVYVKDSSTTYVQRHLDWELDSNGRNARVYQVLSTDSVAGLTKASVMSYTSYNNVSSVSERDFTTNGTVSSTELRHTDVSYVTSSSYTNRHLLHLPSSVKVYPGGSSTPASRVDYSYDNYGSSHANMTARDDIIMHDPAYDPFQPTQENCDWVCREYDYWWVNCVDWQWECTYYNPYDSSTDYRGNVTAVTTYSDAPNASGSITRSMTYDIAGNVMTAQVDCCQQKVFTYSGGGTGQAHDYAYVTSVTLGNPSGTHLTTSTDYDYNTGLVGTVTDENNQPTTNYYNADSLRLNYVTYPDGGRVSYTYSDSLSGDAASSSHFYVETTTKLDGSGGSTRYVSGRRYFDGRGVVARTMAHSTSADGWTVQDVEYDTMGRAYRVSNPYYASGYTSTPLSSSNMFWTTSTFDRLGRTTAVAMPRGDNDNSLTTSITTTFDGVYTTVTEQSGKHRRQKADALGRVVRLDEPTTTGDVTTALGATTSPNQATFFDYDILGNLVHITQGSQHRYFKYDSLSRMIRERQVEQTTNASYNLSDALTGNSSWTRKVEYNSSGLVTNAYDARGVHSTYSYDDINRLTQISYSDSTPTAHYYYDSQSLPSGAPSYTHSNSTGRVLAMTYGSGATGNYFAYDAMGRVVTQKQVTGSTTYGLTYTYNYAGLLTSETYPNGRALAYTYDEGGRLAQVSDGTNTFTSSLAYAPNGALTSETWGNSAVHTMTYNRRLQPSQVKLTLSGTVQQQFDYSYGTFNTSSGTVDTSKNNGRIGRIDSTIGTTAQWNQGFSYDELGRVSNVIEHSGSGMSTTNFSQSYTYDRYGNRFQSANSTLSLNAVSSSEIDASTNRFINSGSTPTTYDASGNITQDIKFRGMNYVYDANGRQTSASSTYNDVAQTSVYDCSGQRVQTSGNGVTRTMVYDVFGQLVAEYLGTSGTTLERENIYRGRKLLAVYEPASSCYKSIADFVDAFYAGAHHTPTTTERNNAIATFMQAQAKGRQQLVAAAQSFGTALFTSSEYGNPSNEQFVTDLYAGYLGRAPDSGGYQFWLSALGNSTRDQVRAGFAYSTEFQSNLAQLCTATSSTSSASYKYVLPDPQGATRAVMNNAGSSSTVVARHDFLPFGEEIWAARSSSQAYGNTDGIRGKYGLSERDNATGLDHTWWREYDSFAGRWTTPDPLGTVNRRDPQLLNGYVYSRNDPINFGDPTGLDCFGYFVILFQIDRDTGRVISSEVIGFIPVFCWSNGPIGGVNTQGPGGGGPISQPGRNTAPKPDQATRRKALDDCINELWKGLVHLLSFEESFKGHSGKTTFTFGSGARQRAASVKNNVTRFTSGDLTSIAYMNSEIEGPGTVRGLTSTGGPGGSTVAWTDINGHFSYTFNPFENFTASNRDEMSGGRFPALSAAVGPYTDTQIHELGNSIAEITGQYVGDPSAKDTDSGEALEKCVAGKLTGGR